MKTQIRSLRWMSCVAAALGVVLYSGMNDVAAQQGGGAGGGANTTPTTGAGGTTQGGASEFQLNTANVANVSEGFIGANPQDLEFVGGSRQSTVNTNTNRQFRAINDQMANQNLQSQQTGTPRSIPVALRLGFAAPTPDMTALGFSPINSPSLDLFAVDRPELSGLNVSVSETGVATLTGVTLSIEARRLAGNLIRYQPGIRRVDNQISVAAPMLPGP